MGNWTALHKEDIYSGVVEMNSIKLGFSLGELNQLTCCAGDVGNAFLYEKKNKGEGMHNNREGIWY